MAWIFGNYRFYQIRGFWYDYSLGEKFKELEEWIFLFFTFTFYDSNL